mgnify:CR=1 FL=1
MASFNLAQRWARLQRGVALPIEASDDLVSTPTVGGYRFAAGTGTLVSGTVAVATGLNTVVGFSANVNRSTGVATGVTEVNAIWVGSITTGSVTVTGSFNSFVTGAATLSASGTSSFYWIAFGT